MVERGGDQAAGLRRMFSEARPRVIELVAGHAGVGRTSVAVHLAAALARIGQRVLLVDLLQAPDSGRALRYLGIGRDSTLRGARAGVASAPGTESLAAIEIMHGARGMPSEQGALDASRASLLHEAAARDCVLVSSMTTELVLAAEDGRREVIVVLSSEPTSITAAYALVKCIAYETGACRFGVVVNRVDSTLAAQRIYHNMARVAHSYLDVKLELLGSIPTDPCVRQAVAHGRGLIHRNATSPAAQAFQQLAGSIVRWPGGEPQRALARGERSSGASDSVTPSAAAVSPT